MAVVFVKTCVDATKDDRVAYHCILDFSFYSLITFHHSEDFLQSISGICHYVSKKKATSVCRFTALPVAPFLLVTLPCATRAS